MQSIDPYLITSVKQNFYCTEITKVGTSGASQREQRTSPNTGWQNSLFANTSGITCTQWMSTESNGADWDENYATTTVNNIYHGDIILYLTVIIFLLSFTVIGLFFNTFFGKRR